MALPEKRNARLEKGVSRSSLGGRRVICREMRGNRRSHCPETRRIEACPRRVILDTGAMRLKVGRAEVNVSNPDKVFFPERGLKKIDLVEYYVDVAPCVLPHLRRRLFHMKRFPNGVDHDFFHQKRVPENHPPYVDEQYVDFPSGHSTVFAVVDNAAALAWVANLGCVELHTWHSRVPDIERPDYLLIDLDPTFDGQWPHVRKIALVVKEVMDELGLTGFPKTSGATGLHILAPIMPELGFPEVRRFAKALAQEVERRVGDQEVATTTWRVADRRGVFVDFGQNARDRTIACAYSVRPTPDARVSTPLRWEEVRSARPERFTISTMRRRIEAVGDPTAGMWRRRPSLVSRFEQLGLEPADVTNVEPRRRGGRRWVSEPTGREHVSPHGRRGRKRP